LNYPIIPETFVLLANAFIAIFYDKC